MPVGEIAGEVSGGVFRFIVHLIIDVFLEVLVRGTGNLICRVFSRTIDPDGTLVLVIGLLFWIVVVLLGVYGYSVLESYLAVDSCLDSGGKYDYENEACIKLKRDAGSS